MHTHTHRHNLHLTYQNDEVFVQLCMLSLCLFPSFPLSFSRSLSLSLFPSFSLSAAGVSFCPIFVLLCHSLSFLCLLLVSLSVPPSAGVRH